MKINGFCILILLFCGCAKEIPPPGGPEDKTPPQVIGTNPRSGEIGVPLDTRIEVQFSERINRKTITDAVFISPPLKSAPRISVKGSRLLIDPDGPLDSTRTYVVTIGARTADLHGNSLRKSQSFAFSTGWTIDSSSISGRVFDNFSPLRNSRVFAYELKPELFDSIFVSYPDYITQTGERGDFQFEFVRQATYLVVGVADADKDNLINAGSEEVALPPSLLVSSPPTDSNPRSYDLHVTQHDSSGATLVSCRGEQGHLELSFGGAPLDSASLSKDSITISARNGATFTPDEAVMFASEPQKVHLWSAQLLSDSSYSVSVSGIQTTTGREILAESGQCQARLRGLDETPPRMIRQGGRRGVTMLTAGDSLQLTWSEPVTIAGGAAEVVVDSSKSFPAEPVVSGATSYLFALDSTLSPAQTYTFILNNAEVSDHYGNHPTDSTYRLTFTIADPESLGVLSGRISTNDSNLIVTVSGLQHQLEYNFVSTGAGEFSWQLYPDKYLVRAFADHNRNARWDQGRLVPLEFAEPAWTMKDTVRIRARFEHTDQVLDFK